MFYYKSMAFTSFKKFIYKIRIALKIFVDMLTEKEEKYALYYFYPTPRFYPIRFSGKVILNETTRAYNKNINVICNHLVCDTVIRACD